MTRVVDSPAASILVALTIVFGCILGLKNLYLDSSTKSLLTKGDPDVEYLRNIEDVFGDAVIHSIILKSDTVFRSDILQGVLDLTFETEGIQGVDRVVSMATVSNLKGDQGILSTDILLMDLPAGPDEMDTLKQDALSNPMFISEVINPSGTVTGIHLFLNNTGEEKYFDRRILKQVDQAVNRVKKNLPTDVEIYHIGTSKLKSDMIHAMNHDAMVLVPLAGLIMAVALIFFFRTGVSVIIPAVTGSLSIAATLGFMGLMGFAINPVSVIIPTLLFVMGATEDIHLLSEYLHELENQVAKKQAILNMAVKTGTAIALTALTTFLGFATIIPNPTPLLREFGMAASFGIAANFIITILTVPVILKLYKTPRTKTGRPQKWISEISRFLFTAVTRYRGGVLGFLCILMLVSVWGITKIYIETDYVKFFQKDADVPVLLNRMDKDLVGGTNFMVVVESKNMDAFQSHTQLRHVAQLHDYLNKTHGKAVGIVDMIRKTHQEMNDGDDAFFDIPENDDLIAQYHLMMDPDNLSRFVNHDFTRTSILVRSRISGTQKIMAAYEDIQRFTRENLSRDLSYHVTGEMIVVAKASNDMTRQIVFCLILMFFAIFLVSSFLFFSFKAGALAMIPNVLPVFVTFGCMGFFDIPLSVATFPVTIIALGIAVDDTLHFMIRHSHDSKRENPV